MAKRTIDLICSALGIALLSPLFLLIAVWIKRSAGPVLFRQVRVGQHGRTFRIHKFRTMVLSDDSKCRQITVGGDPRITPCGYFLRRWKLDELPQLIDVFLGNMSLVGPRPEVPQYVALYPNESRQLILSVKPGITDLASIQYKDENELLARAEDPEREYIETVLPAKIRFYEDYARNHCLWTDIVIIGKTLQALVE